MSALIHPSPEEFPGTLDDGDGMRLAGTGPGFAVELTECLPHKALIRNKLGTEKLAMLEHGDRLWVLPDTFSVPPELLMPLLAELAEVVRRGRKVGLAGRDLGTYTLARNALVLLLDDTGGQA